MTTPPLAMATDADAAPPASAVRGPAGRTNPSGDLAGRVRRGDHDAVADLFREHGERIYNYCGRRAGWNDADDLTSEVFLTALKVSGRAPHDDEALLPWLYAIATNVVRNHTRSGRRGSAALHRLDPASEAADFSDELLATMDADQRVRAALQRLAQFPQASQDAFLLNVWEGLSYEQVALALDCPVGTVRSRIARVRTALRLTDEVSR